MEAERDPIVTEIIRLLKQKPFVPFSLVTRHGAGFVITDPRRVAATDNRVLFTDEAKGFCFFRTPQLSSIEPAVGAA